LPKKGISYTIKLSTPKKESQKKSPEWRIFNRPVHDIGISSNIGQNAITEARYDGQIPEYDGNFQTA
jgi:hypothetical protein